jgi:small-conductance mechanosensitive channel
MQLNLESLQPIIIFLSGIAITILIARIVQNFLARQTHMRIHEEPKLRTTFRFLERVVIAAIILIGIASTTFTAFPETRGIASSLFVAAGFASIVIGLAAQSALSNIISGALIAITLPFRIGDTVKFRNDLCNVEDIKLTYTILRIWDNRRLMIPNSIFQNEVVTNYTAVDTTKLVPISVQISYESDLENARKIMIEIAKRHPDFLPMENLPKVHLIEFAASGVNMRLLTRAKDQDTAFEMSKEILWQIKKEFDANGIEIPYPRMHLVPDKKLEEQIKRIADNLTTNI